MIQKLKQWWNLLAIKESKELIRKKLDDHSSFSGNVFFFGAFLGAGLWGWDYITDPVGAMNTIYYRLSYFVLLLSPWFFKNIKSLHILTIIFITVSLATEAIYLHILTYLDQGMLYGIGGFMFYMLLPPIAFQAFPLRTNIITIILLAALPHLLALAGFVEGFQHANYAVLIWPAAFIAITIQYFYARDYQQRYYLKEALEELSYTDVLSGLYNRRYFLRLFEERLKEAKQLNAPLSLLIIDIDYFKFINDRFGHPAGDEAIKALAGIFVDEVGKQGIVARIGGEEFGVLLPGIDIEYGRKIAESIRQRCASAPLHPSIKATVTVSIGIAETQGNHTASELFKMADQVLYTAKQNGRNRTVTYHS